MLSFGQEVKRLAEEKGLTTQKQLADASRISQQQIARIYLDQRPNVSAVIIYKLCDALSVPADHFRPFLAENEPAPAPKKKKRKA